MSVKTIKSKCGTKVEIVQLNKSKCEKLLASVPDFQRNMKRSNKSKITHAIENKEWKFNGEPLIRDSSDRLIDGQHRVQAFLESEFYPEVILVTTSNNGLDTYNTIDSGASRSMADAFKARGIENATTVCSICLHSYNYENKRPYGTPVNINTAIEYYYDNVKTVQEAYSISRKMLGLISPMPVGVCSNILLKNDLNPNDFVSGMASLIDISSSQASYSKMLLVNLKKVRGKMGKNDHMKAFMYFFKTHTQKIKGNTSSLNVFLKDKSLYEVIDIAINVSAKNNSQ